MLVGDEKAHQADFRRIHGWHVGQNATTKCRHEILERQEVFLPIAVLRRERQLVKRRVQSCSSANGELVATAIAANANQETVEAAQFGMDWLRAHGSKSTVVFQRYHTAKNCPAVGENLKAAGGHAAHDVVVDDLPGGLIGRGLEIEEDSIGCGASFHGDDKQVHKSAELSRSRVEKFEVMCFSESGIQPPQCEVQVCGKADPHEIGSEQPGGAAMHAPKHDDCPGNGQPQQQDFRKRHAEPVQPEK